MAQGAGPTEDAAGAEPGSRPVFRFEVELTDQELATAWVREHYARQGMLRFVAGPSFVALGIYWLSTHADSAARVLGGIGLVYGVFLLARPFLAASRVVAARRRRGGENGIVLELDERSIVLTRAGKSLRFPWKDVTAAGKRPDYLWYEVRGAQRAPIPRRLIADPAALEAFLRAHTRWVDR